MAQQILLADDSVTIQKVVELTLMDQNYDVVAVSDGDSAIERLADSRPDLLIADVHMPGADGYAVCANAKERYPGLPVLLLVGSFEPFDEGKMVACGAEAHLKKPFDSQELLRIAGELLQTSSESDEPGAVEASPEPPAADAATPAAQDSNGSGTSLSDEDVDRIAKRVIDGIGDRIVREVAWDVVPDLAEIVIRERLRDLEGQSD